MWNSGSSLHVSKCKIYLELKWLVIQLLQRRQMWNDHLWRFNTANFIWSQFILNRRNGIKRGKLYFMLLSGGWFTKAATFFQYCWKHCLFLHFNFKGGCHYQQGYLKIYLFYVTKLVAKWSPDSNLNLGYSIWHQLFLRLMYFSNTLSLSILWPSK